MHLPVIHVPHQQHGCAPAVTLLAALGGIGAAIAGAVVSYMTTSESSSIPTAIVPALPATPVVTETRAAETPTEPSGPRVEEDYFADATRVKSRYETALGKPIMAKELVIYQYYATLEAQNPKKPEHVDSYKLWASKVERPKPVRLGADKRALLFSLDTMDFRLLPQLLRRALTELKIEEGKVTHVYLERPSAGAQPVWRVYVNGPRESGAIEFSPTGATVRITR